MPIVPKIGSCWRIPKNIPNTHSHFLGLEFQVLGEINIGDWNVESLVKILKVNNTKYKVGEEKLWRFDFSRFIEIKKSRLPDWF